MGGAGLGDADANLRARAGGDFALFSTESDLAAAPVIEIRAGYALTRAYGLEARVGFSRPHLRTAVSDDVEGAPPLELTEVVTQYVFEGALVVMLDRFRAGNLVPFASAGAGYLRQLHEGRTLIEHGVASHLGGGVKHWFMVREDAFVRAVGVRGDVRLNLLSGGISGDDGVTPHAAVSASLFVTF